MRDTLIADGALVAEATVCRFTRDVLFTSPSAAAAIVAGRSASGPAEWKTKTGLSYRDVKARELAAVA